MNFDKINSWAKINLSLNVVKRFRSKYHKIESLITFVEIFDEIKIRFLKSKKNKIYFTCSTMNARDYQISDYIKIINNNTSTLFQVLQDPLKIKKIQENVIICEYTGLEYLENRIYTDIDMKLMNMSNQNILYFH